jgi:spermidine/putrescine transport system substrate-binding protein
MSRSKPALTTLSLVIAALVVGGSVAAAQSESGVDPALHIFNWEEYVDPQVLEDFEAEYGITVTVDFFGDENEMVSVIQADASRYDLFIGSTSVVHEMADQRLLAELDHANIPNLINIDPRYLDLPLDPGNKYSVAYDWGTSGIAYNTDCATPQDESWGLLADPAVKGRVAMDADFTVVVGSLLKYLGHPLNSRDSVHVSEAITVLEHLVEDQGLEFMVWDEALDRLAAGDLCAVQAFNGDTAVYIDEYDNIDFFVPREGSDFYVDSMAIPRDAANKANAELFMNYILRPDVHANNNEFTGYAVPNRASIEGGYVSAELLEDPVRYPDVDDLEPWEAMNSELRTTWNQAWADFVMSVN